MAKIFAEKKRENVRCMFILNYKYSIWFSGHRTNQTKLYVMKWLSKLESSCETDHFVSSFTHKKEIKENIGLKVSHICG